VALNQFDAIEYFLDEPGSPFWDMKKGDARRANVFITGRPGVVRTTRNVTDQMKVPKNGKELDVLAISTNFDGDVVATWVNTADNTVIKEERNKRFFTGSIRNNYLDAIPSAHAVVRPPLFNCPHH
jgi:hypothetical protein